MIHGEEWYVGVKFYRQSTRMWKVTVVNPPGVLGMSLDRGRISFPCIYMALVQI